LIGTATVSKRRRSSQKIAGYVQPGSRSIPRRGITSLDKIKGIIMPKMKSKSGAAKRFRALGGGGFKRSHAFMRHILSKKST
jgi:hypothetical protein